MQRNYIVTLNRSSAVFMRRPPLIEDTGDSSSDNQRSEGGSGTLEYSLGNKERKPCYHFGRFRERYNYTRLSWRLLN
jgi:hypothetical protein